jgi:hypothetical protein
MLTIIKNGGNIKGQTLEKTLASFWHVNNILSSSDSSSFISLVAISINSSDMIHE